VLLARVAVVVAPYLNVKELVVELSSGWIGQRQPKK
jgi:hypothetical protein